MVFVAARSIYGYHCLVQESAAHSRRFSALTSTRLTCISKAQAGTGEARRLHRAARASQRLHSGGQRKSCATQKGFEGSHAWLTKKCKPLAADYCSARCTLRTTRHFEG